MSSVQPTSNKFTYALPIYHCQCTSNPIYSLHICIPPLFHVELEKDGWV